MSTTSGSSFGSSLGNILLGYIQGRANLNLQQNSSGYIPGYVDTIPPGSTGSSTYGSPVSSALTNLTSSPMAMIGIGIVVILGLFLFLGHKK